MGPMGSRAGWTAHETRCYIVRQWGRPSAPRPSGDGCIAQLVEQLTLNQRVEGSSPSTPTKCNKLARSDISGKNAPCTHGAHKCSAHKRCATCESIGPYDPEWHSGRAARRGLKRHDPATLRRGLRPCTSRCRSRSRSFLTHQRGQAGDDAAEGGAVFGTGSDPEPYLIPGR